MIAPPTRCALLGLVILVCAQMANAQASLYERSFPYSKDELERILHRMASSMAGRLPVLEGFAVAGEHPLDQYARGYYQNEARITPTAKGTTRVRVIAKITAWYTDPRSSRSGYELLTSNGRLETDLLDELEQQLEPAKRGTATAPSLPHSDSIADSASAAGPEAVSPSTDLDPPVPYPAAPMPALPQASTGLALLSRRDTALAASHGEPPMPRDYASNALRSEAEGLEEILKNQSRPDNLVAVKKSGTPVVAAASLTAKTLFLASEHDEFELLDYNTNWVHVRISGLSRGWIWRTSVEMPGTIPDVDGQTPPLPSAEELFHVTREETALFPGDWDTLRDKTVRIISVQPTGDKVKDGGPQVKLAYAKALLEKNYAQVAEKPQQFAGVVLIFDSADGGILAATLSALRQWKAGALSDAALWHRCYFDPPETFGASISAATQ